MVSFAERKIGYPRTSLLDFRPFDGVSGFTVASQAFGWDVPQGRIAPGGRVVAVRLSNQFISSTCKTRTGAGQSTPFGLSRPQSSNDERA